jgi:outer membrane protein insertion porin family
MAGRFWRQDAAGITGTRDGLVLVEKSGRWPGIAAPRGRCHPAVLLLVLLLAAVPSVFAQAGNESAQDQSTPESAAPAAHAESQSDVPGLSAWIGLKVAEVQFRGVDKEVLDPLPPRLALQPGEPLDAAKLRESLRRLYATGLYHTIEVMGTRDGDQVTIIFTGEPRIFIGRVYVDGVKNERLASQIGRAAKLEAGTAFSQARLDRGVQLIHDFLRENGYYQPAVSGSTETDSAESQIDITYHVSLGLDARVGQVEVDGESGMTPEEFRKKAKLKAESKVTRDTTNRALEGLRKVYQKQQRLESDVNLKSKDYQPPTNHLNYSFGVNRGPIVTVEVVGAKLNKGLIKKLIPVYEEGAVDDDLLNEGDRSLRDYYQRAGYFEVKIAHQRREHTAQRSDIVYTVDLGKKHKVLNVSVSGNKYFSSDTIESRLSVLKADIFQHTGLYSQALVNSDVDQITALYQSNGFSNVKVTPNVIDSDRSSNGEPEKIGTITVQYAIDEGQQQKVGELDIAGASQVPIDVLKPLLNTTPGQPYSAANVVGDRNAILSYYLDHGFGQAQVTVTPNVDPANPTLVNIKMNIVEGDEIFVRQVLISGLEHTHPKTVDQLLTVHPGDPLNQAAMLETQRRLYNLALFNEVNTAVQNPAGDELRKNVLLQLTEAKRWDFNYGFGFEAQTGNPSTNCLNATSLVALGINPANYTCSPNGKTGVSPAVLFDVTRTNLRGTNQSISLRTAYGTLEQRATMVYQVPHIFGLQTFDGSLSGGYVNAQDVTTYSSSQLGGSFRLTERPNRRNTFIYEFSYRRVEINESTIQVAPNLIPLYSQPVRVGGPGAAWIRDTRDSPLDAHHGTYNTVQEYFANAVFGSQANFNRVDMTNSSYYQVGKRRWVIARSTRFGMEQSWGSSSQQQIPLPERLYAGGAQSHRGFPINQAGPRDEQTGFPIGGAGVFVNTLELRLPYPTLPYVGNNLGFVIFHDMGNVFNNVSDIGPSFLRFHQPNISTCKTLLPEPPSSPTVSSGPCSFNYFSHAVGLGLRYNTPIGPIRFDLAVNLDPPYYPVYVTYTSGSNPVNVPPHIGQAGYFNFFFSIGQAF